MTDPETAKFEFVLVDTIDAQPPAADGSNLATIRITGQGTHTKGFFYVCGNVYFGGSGSTPDINALDPTRVTHNLKKVRHNGLFIAAGKMDQGGQNTVYGAVVAQRGFGSGGCPEVWYDYRLKDGLWINVQSVVTASLWKSY